MQLTKNGITIEVPDAEVVDLVLQKLNGQLWTTPLECEL